MYALASMNNGKSFAATKLDRWKVGQCVMSSAALQKTTVGMLAAWETEHQVKFGRISLASPPSLSSVLAPAPTGKPRKHPVVCVNSKGEVLLVWTEDTDWQKGGSVAWQLFDPTGHSITEGAGRADGVPVWSFAAVFAGANDEFRIVY
jgi:hypothetical protein